MGTVSRATPTPDEVISHADCDLQRRHAEILSTCTS
jgi:hypothetical protein